MIDLSTIQFCPKGYKETFVKGKESYKDFRRMPHIKCSKGERKLSKKKGNDIAKVTLHNVGYVGSNRYSEVTNAQGYIEKENPKTKKNDFVRHFNYTSKVGKSEYGKFSTLSYHIPNNKKIYIDTDTDSIQKRRAYFVTDSSQKNVYCQPFEDIRSLNEIKQEKMKSITSTVERKLERENTEKFKDALKTRFESVPNEKLKSDLIYTLRGIRTDALKEHLIRKLDSHNDRSLKKSVLKMFNDQFDSYTPTLSSSQKSEIKKKASTEAHRKYRSGENNYTCISGNIRMLNRQEAKKAGFAPSGSFTLWRDMQKNVD